MIGAALVQFQLSDPDPANRRTALNAIERDPEPSHLTALRGAIDDETDPAIKARKERLERLLTIRYGATDADRIAAIHSFSGDLGVDLRATLTPLTATRIETAETLPQSEDIAKELTPGTDALSERDAYQMLVDAGLRDRLRQPRPAARCAARQYRRRRGRRHRGRRTGHADHTRRRLCRACRRGAHCASAHRCRIRAGAGRTTSSSPASPEPPPRSRRPQWTHFRRSRRGWRSIRLSTWSSTRCRWPRSISSPPSGLPSPSA